MAPPGALALAHNRPPCVGTWASASLWQPSTRIEGQQIPLWPSLFLHKCANQPPIRRVMCRRNRDRSLSRNIRVEDTHPAGVMPVFLTLRDGEGTALVTAMLPPAGRNSVRVRPDHRRIRQQRSLPGARQRHPQARRAFWSHAGPRPLLPVSTRCPPHIVRATPPALFVRPTNAHSSMRPTGLPDLTGEAAKTYVPPRSGAFIEQNIGLNAHIQRGMPV